MPKQPVPEGTEEPRSAVDVELDRIKAEIHQFIWDYVPESEREDFELQIQLYLETHPVMAKRIEALRALAREESGLGFSLAGTAVAPEDFAFEAATEEPPRPVAARRVSLVRVGFVLLVVAALIAGGVRWTMAVISDVQAEQPLTAFAPYVDVTLTPTLHFEDSTQQPASHVILGFIVADSTYRCAPSWGTYYTLDAAARALDLDRRLVRLREIGGDATVSFGGAVNDELATVCFDTGQLASAYQDVIDRYDLRAIDFDIEGAALGNVSANERRADAIKALQERNRELRVWLTPPRRTRARSAGESQTT